MQLSHQKQKAEMPPEMPKATLTISSKNYSSWCLRGWLMCKLGGLEFDEVLVSLDDPGARAELLLLSPSFLVPCLTHDGAKIWDTLAIAEYVAEANPEAGLLPADRRYFRFMGSLTTPPCSEDVLWNVLATPVELSAQQLAAFRTLFEMNARPVQPLNGRKVILGP